MSVIQSLQVCTFYVDGQLFAVEAKSVQEVIRYQDITEVPMAPSSIVGLINLRGQIVTAIDLRTRLGLPKREPGKLPMNVVIRSGENAISLLVDQIGEVQSVDAGDFESPPDTLRSSSRQFISGTYKMSDGLLLLLDIDRTLEFDSADP